MLLLDSYEINPDVKIIFDHMIEQLKKIAEIINQNNLKDYENFKKVAQVCDKILNSDKQHIMLETFFSSNSLRAKEELEVLSSLVNLNTKEMKELSLEYKIKYPTYLNFNKKDYEIIKEALLLSHAEDICKIPELKTLNKMKENESIHHLVNYLLKKCSSINDSDFDNFIKKLQSKFLAHPSMTMENFNKYFNLENKKFDLNHIENVTGVAVMSSVLNKHAPEKNLDIMMEMKKLKQISFKEVLESGFIFNMDKINQYHFFKSQDAIYTLDKNRPILDTTLEDLKSMPVIGKEKNGYTDIVAKINLRENDFFDRDEKQNLNYQGLKKLRTALFLTRPKWSVGSLIKQENVLYYVADQLMILDNGDLKFKALILNPQNETEYFIKDIIINQKNHKTFELADKIDKLFFFEAVNSSFQFASTQRESDFLHKTMTRKLGY